MTKIKNYFLQGIEPQMTGYLDLIFDRKLKVIHLKFYEKIKI